MKDIIREELNIRCADDFSLAASLFKPKGGVNAAVMIGPATGIKRQFYQQFASYLAEKGYGVLTFDNRGIGQSLKSQLKHCEVSLQCWGEKDMPAVLNQLKLEFPDASYHLIGHSAGGQLVGLMDNAHDLASLFNVACSSGRLKNMSFSHKIKAHFFMNVFIPICNRVFGHTKSQWLGMGEPLPKNVARQWQTWCNGQGYVKTAFGKTVHQHLYDELKMPSLWLNAEDDDIAIDENVQDMISVFPSLPAKTLTLSAEEQDLNEIGHMKFFSRQSKKLWPLATDWLEQHK